MHTISMIEPAYVRAVFSQCRTWRYILRRRWRDDGDTMAFIMLNPSTADEETDDPTIRRCIAFAMRDRGMGGIVVGNLFAYRATIPDAMKASADPIGPENDDHLVTIATEAGGRVVCGWGEHGSFMNRGMNVAAMLKGRGVETVALGINAGGQPKHPLYIRSDSQFVPWP